MMAADQAVAELARSLSIEETPVKLRCATCSQIAYNALRLPCCEQNICETCYNDLEDVCQVCHHEPLDKNLCTPNKSLRTTTKVFLKKKLFERAKEQKKKGEETPKDESAPAMEPPASGSAAVKTSIDGDNADTTTPAGVDETEKHTQQGQETTTGQDISSETAPLLPESTRGEKHGDEVFNTEKVDGAISDDQETQKATDGDSDRAHVDQSKQSHEQDTQNQWQNGDMPTMNGGGFGAMNGAFPMDFNQMNQMMASGMQMPNGGFPNMMGMGMDPTLMNQMSQQMFGGFGGQNMGMNGMNGNMGMGFNGQGQFGGPWAGQGNYNGGGYNNGGYGGQSGYNMSSHGNYNQMNHQQYSNNDYSNGYGRQGFHARGRGRGRGFYNGGYGRNYHGYNQNGYGNQNSNHAYQQQSYQAGSTAPTNGADAEPVNDSGQKDLTAEETDAKLMKEFAPGGEEDDDRAEHDSIDPKAESAENTHTAIEDGNKPDDLSASNQAAQSAEMPLEQQTTNEQAEDTMDVEDQEPRPIQSFISDEPRNGRGMFPPTHAPLGPSGRVSNRATSTSSIGTHVALAIPEQVPGVVGAPKGPRAMREGLPNTGRSAFAPIARPSLTPMAPPKEPEPEQEPELREESPRPCERSPSRSYSRSRSRHDRHKSSRHHSRSISPDDRYEKRDERRHRRSRHYDEDERIEDDSKSKRSSHRSRRHDRDHESKHRRHRDRSHDRKKDKERYDDYYKEKERPRDEEYYRDGERAKDDDSYYDDGVRDRDDGHHRSRDKGKDDDYYRDQERSKDDEYYREKYRDEESHDRSSRRHRRHRSRTPTDSIVPTPTSANAPEYPTTRDCSSSRKRRPRDDDYDHEYDREHDRHERKRSRRDRSPTPDRRSSYTGHSREPSKPNTPMTPAFPAPSRRTSDFANGTGVVGAPSGPREKAIPTGPKASFAPRHNRDDRPSRAERHSAAGIISAATKEEPAKKVEKDPHTLEREARDRERMMKEIQRRATMEGPRRKGGASIKGGGRRGSVKYEDEGLGDGERSRWR